MCFYIGVKYFLVSEIKVGCIMISFQLSKFNTSNTLNTSNSVQLEKAEPVKESNESKSTATKVLLGAGALAAIVVGGLFYRNKAAAKKAAEAIAQAAKENAEKLKKLKTQKSVNAGETVAETIENIFGKESSIKPHTYDTSLEFHTIPCYRYSDGYKDGWVTKAGIIEDIPANIPDLPIVCRSISYVQNLEPICFFKKKGIAIYKGFVEGSKNRVVRLEMDDPFRLAGESPTKIIFSIISPNDKYTPVQQDLMKLAQNPEKIDVDVFDRISKFKNDIRDGKPMSRENYGKYENLDYDLILSAIQSMTR